MKSLKVMPLFLAACACIGSTGAATWIGTDGNWNVAENWDGGEVPTTGTAEITNGGTARIGDGDNFSNGNIVVGAAQAGHVVQTGGFVTVKGASPAGLAIGSQQGCTEESVYELRNGDVNITGYAQIGQNSKGTLLISGGTVSCPQWFSIGRYSGGVGKMAISGGSFTQTGNATIVGEDGSGSLEVSDTGVYSTPYKLLVGPKGRGQLDVKSGGVVNVTGTLDIGEQANSHGLVRVHSGGTLNVAHLTDGLGAQKSFMLMPGGTLGTAGTNPANSLVDQLEDVTFYPGASINVPQGSKMTVALADNGKKSFFDKTKHLAHRWSFNGDLTDSVGGRTATMDGGATISDGKVCLPGGSHGAGAVSLGANLLPTNGNVTIEIWATQQGVQTWCRIFSVGSKASDEFCMTWNKTGENSDAFFSKIYNKGWENKLQPYTLGTEFHIAMTISEPTDGWTYFKIYKQDAVTGETLKKIEDRMETSKWNLVMQSQEKIFLGRSLDAHDKDSIADYNEVRIWNTVLTEEELSVNAIHGADATFNDAGLQKTGSGVLVFTGPVDDYVFDVQEGTLSLGSPTLLHRWSFNGDLSDSAGGRTATADGVATISNGKVCLPGGNNGTGAVNLGSGLLPITGGTTIEMWATQQGLRSWSRIFSIGSDTADEFCLAWTRGTNLNQDDFISLLYHNDWQDKLAPYTIGTEFHIAMTISEPTDGYTHIKIYKQDAVTGETLKKLECSLETEKWTLAMQKQDKFYLGRSLNTNDKDAQADYNEVRIWNAELSEAQLTALGAAGADAQSLPVSFASTDVSDTESATVKLADDGVLNLCYGTTGLKSLEGTGTVCSGSVTADAIRPAGKGTIGTLSVAADAKLSGTVYIDCAANGACDRLAYAGAMDATGLSIAVEEGAVLNGNVSYVIATFAPNAFTGEFASVSLPGSWKLKVDQSAGDVSIVNSGVVILIR